MAINLQQWRRHLDEMTAAMQACIAVGEMSLAGEFFAEIAGWQGQRGDVVESAVPGWVLSMADGEQKQGLIEAFER